MYIQVFAHVFFLSFVPRCQTRPLASCSVWDCHRQTQGETTWRGWKECLKQRWTCTPSWYAWKGMFFSKHATEGMLSQTLTWPVGCRFSFLSWGTFIPCRWWLISSTVTSVTIVPLLSVHLCYNLFTFNHIKHFNKLHTGNKCFGSTTKINATVCILFWVDNY